MIYKEFLGRKRPKCLSVGKAISDTDINNYLFPFQRDLTKWAVRKGRCAIFADTGLGKTCMQIEWAVQMGGTALIVAPLSVTKQTIREGSKLGISITPCRSMSDVEPGLNITNYEMIEHFDPAGFDSVVLDESSILKSITGKTRQKLIDMFSETKYRLCCTATPAPNDIAEIANHAAFLGIMSRADMLATFFVHDDNGYRLKGHAKEAFYEWLASWGMSIKFPSNIGHSDEGYILPELTIDPVFVKTAMKPDGSLFFTKLHGIQDRASVRRKTLHERCDWIIEKIKADADQWIVWCGLNDEQDYLTGKIPDSVSVYGHHDIDQKTDMIERFLAGDARILITKPKIAGFGMNFQHSHKMAFVGLSDSYETYYQCIRRSYRFGQKSPVDVFIVLSEAEGAIYDNVIRKEREAKTMSDELIKNVAQYEKEEIAGIEEKENYQTDTKHGKDWTMMLGDSCERMAEIKNESIDLSVFSPPFMSLYTYSATERDIGNSNDPAVFFDHFGFISRELLRITKPGRLVCCHVAQVPAMMVRDGYIGLKDFRGDTIRLFESNGWIYHGEVCIDKDPQAQAIRTKSKALLFTQMHKDSSWSRQALADYILLFRKPGENKVPIKPDIDNNQWIEWARPIWYGIRESDTLQYTCARSDKDERHICPLQLETIERCIRLWSNYEETILSPFAGIGSEGYEAIRLGRKFIGIELKDTYWEIACQNLAEVTRKQNEDDLFSRIAE